MTDFENQPVGGLVDSLGVQAALKDDDMPTDAIVILRIVEPDGSVRLSWGQSEGLGSDWLTRRAMLTVVTELQGRCGCGHA